MLRYLEKLLGRICRRRRPPTPPLLGLDILLSDLTIKQDSEAEIARRLTAMPLFVRETYLLSTVDRMSIEQIAHRLALSRREVRRNLRRAIAFLLA